VLGSRPKGTHRVNIIINFINWNFE